VPQLPAPFPDRRSEPRSPAAFAFWYRAADEQNWHSAWMLNTCTGGAAFLTAADEAPRIGQRLLLREMHCPDRFVRDGCPPLPASARVLRIDDQDGPTRRVAVRFEADVSAELEQRRCQQCSTSRRQGKSTPPPPPLARRKSDPRRCQPVARA
jgi:hypothetical protein